MQTTTQNLMPILERIRKRILPRFEELAACSLLLMDLSSMLHVADRAVTSSASREREGSSGP